MDEDPFPDLNISSHDFLESMDGRSECPKCHKSRKYYCYTCYVPVKGAETKTPKVKLPLKIDIIKHPSECDGKSTAIHAGVLASDDVSIYTYPCIPDYPDRDKVVLVFPSDDSVTLEMLAGVINESKEDDVENIIQEENSDGVDTSRLCNDEAVINAGTVRLLPGGSLSKDEQFEESNTEHLTSGNESLKQKNNEISGNSTKHDTENLKTQHDTENLKTQRDTENQKRKLTQNSDNFNEHISSKKRQRKCNPPFNRVVFIDSTWNQTKRIYSDERLKGLKQIELKTRKTKFWRHQRDNPDTHLSTIEAIYYFVRDYHDLFVLDDYKGEYDNLLFFFTFMYKKIRNLYDGGKTLKAYQQRIKTDEMSQK